MLKYKQIWHGIKPIRWLIKFNFIKCKEATFPTVLMWRRQANSVILANAIHRKIRWMSDGTGTQVKVQMVNKCKTLINLRRLYKRRKSP